MPKKDNTSVTVIGLFNDRQLDGGFKLGDLLSGGGVQVSINEA